MGTRSGTLAIDGGTPVRRDPFPNWPVFGDTEERLLLEVLHSGKWSSLTGDKVASFCGRFAAFQGANYGTCVPNGTLALEIALLAADIGPGDEVITTPYTFIATANSILAIGARPVFVDIDPTTYNIDAGLIQDAITPRTKAIVPVHIGGQAADMDAILAIARRHGLRVIEDACHGWGASWKGQGLGAIGDLGAVSFQASKNLTAGEGGIVLTNDPALHERCWSLHNVGRVPDGRWYQHESLGRNLRMTEWQGAVLLGQLERLPAQMATRDIAAGGLTEAITQEVRGLRPLAVDPRVTRHGNHLFVMRYDATAFGGHTSEEFVAALVAEGITPASVGYLAPLTRTPAIRRALTRRFGPESVEALPVFPVAERVVHETVWLNHTALLGSESDIESIVTAIVKIQAVWS